MLRTGTSRTSARSEQIEFRVRLERHRRWRPEDRLRIVRETLQPGAVIATVASRHGIGTGLLYTWRKELLTTAVAGFVPVQVEPEARGALLARNGEVEEHPEFERIRRRSGVNEVH
jgi:transposase